MHMNTTSNNTVKLGVDRVLIVAVLLVLLHRTFISSLDSNTHLKIPFFHRHHLSIFFHLSSTMPRLTRTTSCTNGDGNGPAPQTQPSDTQPTNKKQSNPASKSKTAPKKRSKRGNQTTCEANQDETQDPVLTGASGTQDPRTQQTTGIEEDGDDEDERPTIKNYEQHMDAWPASRIRTAIKKYKSKAANRLSPEVQAKARLIHAKYEHQLLMLALVDRVSLRTIENAL